ncbi:MAG: PilN domain-containing protein, partial [Methylobacter tundripaludum]
MPNLNSTIDLDVKKFFRWWLRELDFLVPEKIRQLVNEKQGFIIVRPEGNRLALAYELNGQEEPLATLDRNASGVERYKALRAKDERLVKANLVLRLTG